MLGLPRQFNKTPSENKRAGITGSQYEGPELIPCLRKEKRKSLLKEFYHFKITVVFHMQED